MSQSVSRPVSRSVGRSVGQSVRISTSQHESAFNQDRAPSTAAAACGGHVGKGYAAAERLSDGNVGRRPEDRDASTAVLR